jgi:hypothetical protein
MLTEGRLGLKFLGFLSMFGERIYSRW